jgi:hypothetical protein
MSVATLRYFEFSTMESARLLTVSIRAAIAKLKSRENPD